MIYVQRASNTLRQKAFELRTVTIWNSLPDCVEEVNATNINMFKDRLDKHWKNQDIWYSYRTAVLTVGNKQEHETSTQKIWFLSATILTQMAQHRGY